MLAEGQGFGAPIPDPARLLDLPRGFSYKIVSQYGQTMSDGRQVPNSADGMGCTTLPDGRLCLMRNHELGADELKHGACPVGAAGDAAAFDCYRAGSGEALPGGVSTIILDPATLDVEEQYLSLVGTIYNCSGWHHPLGHMAELRGRCFARRRAAQGRPWLGLRNARRAGRAGHRRADQGDGAFQP